MTAPPEFVLGRRTVSFGGVTFTTLITGADSAGGLCAFEVELAPRALTGPLHTHHREHAFTLLLEGRVRVQVGDVVADASPGQAVAMPKGVPHTFWNPSDRPSRSLEIATPAGVEGYYASLADALATGGDVTGVIVGLAGRYGIEFHWDSLATLLAEHELVLIGDPAADAGGVAT